MREIKFRAWHKEKKYMRYDDIYPDEKRDWDGWEQSLGCMLTVMQMDFELMQFTGLKDKNGKEIYESDLLKRLDGEIDEVVFDGGCFCVKHKAGDMDLISAHNNFEIVGNVYER